MKMSVYIRATLKGLIIALIIYFAVTVYFTFKMFQSLPEYRVSEIITYNLIKSPFNIMFLIPVFVFLILNIKYLILFTISKIFGIKSTAEIIKIENKNGVLNPRIIKHRIVVRTPDGYIGKSVYYHINLTRFHECFPESKCTVYLWRNRAFITDIR